MENISEEIAHMEERLREGHEKKEFARQRRVVAESKSRAFFAKYTAASADLAAAKEEEGKLEKLAAGDARVLASLKKS